MGIKISIPFLYFLAFSDWLLFFRNREELSSRLKASKPGLVMNSSKLYGIPYLVVFTFESIQSKKPLVAPSAYRFPIPWG
jgi:hypothetical protein